MISSHSYSFLSYDTGELGAAAQRSRLFQRDIHASHSAARGMAVLLLLSATRKEMKHRARGAGFRFVTAITNRLSDDTEARTRATGPSPLPICFKPKTTKSGKRMLQIEMHIAIEKQFILDEFHAPFSSHTSKALPFSPFIFPSFSSLLPVENFLFHLKIEREIFEEMLLRKLSSEREK